MGDSVVEVEPYGSPEEVELGAQLLNEALGVNLPVINVRVEEPKMGSPEPFPERLYMLIMTVSYFGTF